MLPSHYACEYQFRCPVLHVERIEFFARTIFQLRVQFVGEDHELVEGMLYVPESILEGYVPKAGDDVEGEYWMTGYLP